jgi:cytochrome oxidase assembly protein ShyY1
MSRHWLTMLAMAAIFAVACFFLGRWQWGKNEDSSANADRINSHYSASPIPLSSAMPRPDVTLPKAEEWTMVTATGRYATNHLMLVRNRPNYGAFGYEVVVPLELAGGTSILVDRGWIPNGPTASEPSTPPATPAGIVTVTGWLRPGEPSLEHKMSNGELASINLPEAHAQTGMALYGAYLLRRSETTTASKPIQAPQPLAPPVTDLGPYLAYALQWWLALPVGFVLVFVWVRREYLEGNETSTICGDATLLARPTKVKKIRIWDEEDE